MDTTDEGYAGKRGDFAFCDKDFKTAIQCYSQVLFCYRIKDETWINASNNFHSCTWIAKVWHACCPLQTAPYHKALLQNSRLNSLSWSCSCLFSLVVHRCGGDDLTYKICKAKSVPSQVWSSRCGFVGRDAGAMSLPWLAYCFLYASSCAGQAEHAERLPWRVAGSSGTGREEAEEWQRSTMQLLYVVVIVSSHYVKSVICPGKMCRIVFWWNQSMHLVLCVWPIISCNLVDRSLSNSNNSHLAYFHRPYLTLLIWELLRWQKEDA